MSTLKSSWETWHPKTRQDEEEILREMEEVLASPQFCNSKRYPALLRYVVQSTLSGHSALLKERTLGVEIFHRLKVNVIDGKTDSEGSNRLGPGTAGRSCRGD